jgi:VWFA-related protein
VVVCGLLPSPAWSDSPKSKPSQQTERAHVADRTEQPEVAFDPVRGQVTVRVSPRHLHDVKIPFPLRERLAVLENGVRQAGAVVNVEHSPITVGVLIENGGRSHQLNESVSSDAAMLIRPLLDVLDTQDRLGVFAYDDSVRTVVDFDSPHDQWSLALGRRPKPRFSETNFYDAVLEALDRLAGVPGRKGLVILSSGIDTFSRATFADVLRRAEQAKVPVYVFNLGELARRRLSSASRGLLSRVDWAECGRQLERLAEVSGGRAYSNAGTPEVDAVYDEIIEELKVRYVLTYAPTLTAPSSRRTVHVAVVDALSPEAAASADRSRRQNDTRVIAEATYTSGDVPSTASAVADAEG